MLKDPIKIWYDDIPSVIGSPKDFKEVQQTYKKILDQKKDASEITEAECAELGQTFALSSQAVPMEEVSKQVEEPRVEQVVSNPEKVVPTKAPVTIAPQP